MSQLRHSLRAIFGRDFADCAPCLPGARLRFELGVGAERAEYLREARARATTLLRAIVVPPSSPWIEITFFPDPDDAHVSPAASIERMRAWGIEPVAGTAWERE